MSTEHKESPVGVLSSHPPGYVQAGDPGAVGASRPWVDTTSGAGKWLYKLRNAADSAWEIVASIAYHIRTTTGPTILTVGAIADGEALRRTGSTVVGDPDVARTNVAQTYTKPQRGAYVTLTSTAGAIAVDLALSDNYEITLGENSTLSAPSNVVAGQSGSIAITQDGTGSRTLAYNAFWDFSGATPALSTAAGSIDVLSYLVLPGATKARVQLSID